MQSSASAIQSIATITSEALMMAAAAMPFLRPRSSTASLGMEAVTTAPLMSRRTWAVVWPLITSTMVPRKTFLALSFIGSLLHWYRAVKRPVASKAAFRHRRIAWARSSWHRFAAETNYGGREGFVLRRVRDACRLAYVDRARIRVHPLAARSPQGLAQIRGRLARRIPAGHGGSAGRPYPILQARRAAPL